MYAPFFTAAMTAPGRQSGFRTAAAVHALYAAAFALPVMFATPLAQPLPTLAHALLVAGIVEGATLLGWRLTQLPKSQALEFLLVSPMQPRRIFLSEAAVGAARLGLVTLAGLPVLALLFWQGRLTAADLAVLAVMPATWGLVTGLFLTMWAYEPVPVRRAGEVLFLLLIVVYLTLGVLLGEKLGAWIAWAAGPGNASAAVAFIAWAVRFSPFDVVQQWFTQPVGFRDAEALFDTGGRVLQLEVAALAGLAVLAVRAASRMHGHFHDRHYSPVTSTRPAELDRIGDAPLSWWAVKRVMEYAGRSNLYLAGGFGLVYAVYVVAGPAWPPWLGRSVLHLFDTAFGGVPGVTAGLVVLASVPAAFQYGLWDSSAQDRARRMELLLLTDLSGRDYWRAAAAAAWVRGRGYFAVAVMLWVAGLMAGRLTAVQAVAAAAAGTILWGLSFALGFRAFSRGMQANGLGSLLTLGVPLAVYLLLQDGRAVPASLLPPGGVYLAAARPVEWWWAVGPAAAGVLALALARSAVRRCDGDLRRWYDRNHAARAME